MQPTRDHAYEEMAATLQCIQIKMLNDVLRQHGIIKTELREKICGDFTFALGDFIDRNWFETEGRRLFPLICFTETFLDSDTDPANLGNVYLPSTMFSFHEYAFGNISYFFEEHGENIPDLDTGRVGEGS